MQAVGLRWLLALLCRLVGEVLEGIACFGGTESYHYSEEKRDK